MLLNAIDRTKREGIVVLRGLPDRQEIARIEVGGFEGGLAFGVPVEGSRENHRNCLSRLF